MKRECKPWISSLQNAHCGCFSLSCIYQANWRIFLQILTNFPYLPYILRMCQHECRRFFTNVLRSLTNALRSLPIRMSYDCSRICCEYAFLTKFRSMFLTFARPQECLRTAHECLRSHINVLRSLRIVTELHSLAHSQAF